MNKKIYLLRHGDVNTEDNIKRYYSRTNLCLDDIGKDKVNLQIEYLKDKNINNIYSSPLDRCLYGAEKLQKFLKIKNFEITDQLLELSVGKWEGKSFDYIKNKYPELFKLRGEQPTIYRPSQGENLLDLQKRIFSFLNKIISNIGNTALFTHKTIIQVLLSTLQYNDLDKAWSIQVPLGSVAEIELENSDLKIIYKPKLANNYPTDKEIIKLWKKHNVPSHIINHMVAVMNVSNVIYNSLSKIGFNIDWNMLRTAALLHDFLRIHKNHEELASVELNKLGYTQLAKIINNHNNFDKSDSKTLDEISILYLADKYCLEDNIVSIDERFLASRKKCKTKESKYYHDKRKEYAYFLEQEVNKLTGLNIKKIKDELEKDYENII